MTAKQTLRPLPSDTRPGIFSRQYAAATLTFATVMFLTGFAALAVVPTLPTAAEDLNGVSLFPLVAGSFVAASLLGGVLGGHWADRSGARRPLALGMILSVVTLLVSASSVSIWQLVAGRFVDGLAAGMVAVSVTTAIGQSYPEYLRPRMLAMMSASWIIPSLVGPPVAGVVAEVWSWRTVFYGLAVLTALPAIALVAVLRKAPSGEGAEAPPADLPPAEERASRPPLVVAGMLSLGAALGQYGVSGWDARHLLFVVAGVALLVVFAPRLLPEGTWRSARGLPTAVLLRGLTSGTYFTVEALVPLMLITERRVAAVTVGVAFTASAVLWAVASWAQGKLLQDVARHRLVTVGALIMAVSVAFAVAGSFSGVSPLLAMAAMPLAAIGMGMLDPCVTVLSLSHSAPDRLGHTTSAMQTNMNLGQVVVLAFATAVLNAGLAAGTSRLGGYAITFSLLLLPTLLVAVLAVRARKDVPE
ncbi:MULTISPECIES: MFS transporter [Streptomyces]|uniref:MFS transporter n=1 Tax=Streptomyces TaxID=1883 RepID=UPI00093EFA91|nr:MULTISPECIES: MFS transporter [unclassified Streptomyces]OKJ12750.1 MFS transporter permease [Streptomyces sp. TSRI0261]QNQ36756.1 MFS transporter [Streptomyces sp. CB00271]